LALQFFIKAAYALHRIYENHKAHFWFFLKIVKPTSSSSHHAAMVFVHIKALRRALPDLGHDQLHLVKALILVKPLP